MKPVMQDKFKGYKYGGGNCLQAAVASLLDLELEEVPHFLLFGQRWDEALYLFMKSMGITNGGYIFYDEPIKSAGIFGYFIGVGMSKRGVYHSVIYKDGLMVHDPHPDNTGIELKYYYNFYIDAESLIPKIIVN